MLRANRAGSGTVVFVDATYFARDLFELVPFPFLAAPRFAAARFLVGFFLPKADSQPAENFSVDPVRTMVKMVFLRRFR